ncbi:MAG: GGDEF domain-containing protein [Lachnospiraceae bacterium]|nr:GGDEF domain-containing protein [Lachnospiraceae bacterium]
MSINKLEDYTPANIADLIIGNTDAVLVVDSQNDSYRRIISHGFFSDFIAETGSYHDLIESLYFHISNSGKKVEGNYRVFIPTFGEFHGKYSKNLKLTYKDITHQILMQIYPVEESRFYILTLNELDNSTSLDEFQTDSKVTTIQKAYLFSMYFDLIKNTTSSLSITEISDETMNSQLSYTDWRMGIVNAIWPDDQPLFLERTDPDYLKAHFKPGQTSSFDCLMANLEGKFIWVKLTFSRAQTTNDDDYRFVFMVQDINEDTVAMMTTLKKYEELASIDPLTGILNHGRIETEMCNTIENNKKTTEPAAFMMLDIDHFKSVNDNFGHSVGDKTLKHFAEILDEQTKKYNGMIGRWGGEEFVAVFSGLEMSEIKRIAEEMREAVSNAEFTSVGHITTSIGVTGLRANDDFQTVFERMDKMLYEAKSSGRDHVCVAE